MDGPTPLLGSHLSPLSQILLFVQPFLLLLLLLLLLF